MGIYADSPSILSISTQSAAAKDKLDSQLRTIARTLHSHPSPYGAKVVLGILLDNRVYSAW